MAVHYPEIGVCGLSCRLCPRHHAQGPSRCGGCKSESRMSAGCPFITCALKRQGIEFCWECEQSGSCERWAGHREYGRSRDTFVCYASLEDNIATVRRDGLESFVDQQDERERLLRQLLAEFNEGRSKSYFCIAATVLEPAELAEAIASAREVAHGMEPRDKARIMHSLLDEIASSHSLKLALRK